MSANKRETQTVEFPMSAVYRTKQEVVIHTPASVKNALRLAKIIKIGPAPEIPANIVIHRVKEGRANGLTRATMHVRPAAGGTSSRLDVKDYYAVKNMNTRGVCQ